MTDREKMVEIINSVQAYGIMRNAFGGDLPVTNEMLADALIDEGIGDVMEWKEKVECAKRILQIPTLPNGTTDLSYFEYKGERIQDIVHQRDEYKHRVEVAERALATVCEEVLHARYPVESVTVSVVNDFIQHTLKEAEREIEEEKRNDKMRKISFA